MKKELFVSADHKVSLSVLADTDEMWLNQSQMAKLFGVAKRTISDHVANALKEECIGVVGRNFLLTTQHGAIEGKTQTQEVTHYPIEVVFSVGYRVRSPRGIEFRRWANNVLRNNFIDMLKKRDARIKDLLVYKKEIERREDLALEYRNDHRCSKIQMINISTGKQTTLWNLPVDVRNYLLSLTKVERGLLFDKWKRTHNFNEFVRFRMNKEKSSIKGRNHV